MEDAANLLRSSNGLADWDCVSVRRYGDGSERFRYRSDTRTIAVTVGACPEVVDARERARRAEG